MSNSWQIMSAHTDATYTVKAVMGSGPENQIVRRYPVLGWIATGFDGGTIEPLIAGTIGLGVPDVVLVQRHPGLNVKHWIVTRDEYIR